MQITNTGVWMLTCLLTSGLQVLAQFANMNLMAQATAVIPKAGFPINQLPLHVYTLNQEGFSVVRPYSLVFMCKSQEVVLQKRLEMAG